MTSPLADLVRRDGRTAIVTCAAQTKRYFMLSAGHPIFDSGHTSTVGTSLVRRS